MLKQESGRGPGAERVRALLAVATLPLLAGYAAIAAVYAVVAALATQATFAPGQILLGAAPGWLAAHQVPLTLGGQHLALLPLGMTIGIGVLLARSAAGAAERLDCRTPQQAVAVIGTMAGAHAVAGVTVAIVSSGARITADPLASFCLPGLFAAVAASLGLARRCGLIAAARAYTDDAAVAGIRAGLLGLAGLLTVGAAVLAVASVFSAMAMSTLFHASAPGFGSGLGMLVLCVAYVPNAVLATLGFTIGPGFSFGSFELSPFSYTGGDVPAVPLLAVLPEGPAGWWRALFVLPAVVGVVVGLKLRRSSPDPFQRLRSAGVAGAVVGLCTVVLGALAGGRVGSSSGLTLPLGWLSVAAFCWVAVPAALVAWFAGERPPRPSRKPEPAEPEPELAVPDAELAAPDAELAAEDGELAVPDAENEPAEDPVEEEPAEPEGQDESTDSPAESTDSPDTEAPGPAKS